MKSAISSYVSLTKPTIVSLFAVTGLTAMVIEGSLSHTPLKFFAVLAGIILTAGSANALNMFFDRDIDEIMSRTRVRRPLPLHKITPHQALFFGLIVGAIALGLLQFFGNTLSAFLGGFTIFFYVVIYTLILKRRTPYNIVIGGIAGATAPLIGWAAATGQIGSVAWLLFWIIVFWTPPHFWALALVSKYTDDYRNAGVPMLPVSAGPKRTRVEVLVYTLLLLPLTLAPPLVTTGGLTYALSAAFLGGGFIWFAIKLSREKSDKAYLLTFAYSIFYLFALFFALMLGHFVHGTVLR